MHTKLRANLSYANVVASLALFIALGGGAYAAATLPKNSVGATQIKKNAVTSAKVKDGSLLKKDFRAGDLPAGATGPAGPKGDKGDPGTPGTSGTNGTNGGTGPRGPSDGFDSANSPNGSVGAGIEDSIALPAGKFLVTAKANIGNAGAMAASVTCNLKAAAFMFPSDSSEVIVAAAGAGDFRDVVFLQASFDLASAGSVGVDCDHAAGSSATSYSNLRIQAVQVEDLSVEEIA